jgi:hypothetical protein
MVWRVLSLLTPLFIMLGNLPHCYPLKQPFFILLSIFYILSEFCHVAFDFLKHSMKEIFTASVDNDSTVQDMDLTSLLCNFIIISK